MSHKILCNPGLYIHLKGDQEPKKIFINSNKLYILGIDVGRSYLGIRIEKRYINDNKIVIIKNIFTQCIEIENDKINKHSLLYQELDTILFSLDKVIKRCDLCLIEKQMNKNTNAIRDMQYYITMLRMLTNNKCLVIEVSSKLKSSTLGCSPKTNVKKFCESKAIELLDLYGDFDTIEYINELKNAKIKVYDVTDIICMIESVLKKICKNHPLTI